MFPCARALDPRGKTLIATRALFWLKMGRRYCIVSVSCTSYTFALFSIKNIHFKNKTHPPENQSQTRRKMKKMLYSVLVTHSVICVYRSRGEGSLECLERKQTPYHGRFALNLEKTDETPFSAKANPVFAVCFPSGLTSRGGLTWGGARTTSALLTASQGVPPSRLRARATPWLPLGATPPSQRPRGPPRRRRTSHAACSAALRNCA